MNRGVAVVLAVALVGGCAAADAPVDSTPLEAAEERTMTAASCASLEALIDPLLERGLAARDAGRRAETTALFSATVDLWPYSLGHRPVRERSAARETGDEWALAHGWRRWGDV